MIFPPFFCRACLSFYREKDSAVPFPLRPLSRILFTWMKPYGLLNIVIFKIFKWLSIIFFFFYEEKSQFV